MIIANSLGTEYILPTPLGLGSSVGSASWIWCKAGNGFAPIIVDANSGSINEHFPAFLVRLGMGECKVLGWELHLSLRLGLLSINHIPLIYVLLRIKGVERIYQAWINHYDFMQPSPVYALRERQSIGVLLFEGESIPRRYVEFESEEVNQRSSQILSFIQNSRHKWTMADFDIARASLSCTAEQLWERG